MIAMIEFERPVWFFALLFLLPALAGIQIYAEWKRTQALAALSNPKLTRILTANISRFRRILKHVLLLAAVFCFVVALARPQMGYRWEEVKRRGIDILFAIDTSRSMLAQDVRPSRLERSKLAVIDFSRNFGGGRLGLVPFAGSAFLMCPLTLDMSAFYESLEVLDTNVIGRPGTDIGSAIRESSQAFSKGAGDEKVLILITDGEDLEGDAIGAAKEVAAQGVKIYTVGVGTPGGELIPDFRSQGGVSFMKDQAGQFVKSRLDENMLKQISSVTGGRYYPLGSRGEGLEAILRENQHLMKELEVKESMRKVPLEQFQWPLALGLILLLVETLIRETRQPAASVAKAPTHGSLAKKTAVTTLLFFMGFNCGQASVLREAEKNMKSGRYKEAAGQYQEAAKEEPQESALVYNRGVAAYRAGEMEEAVRAFEEGKRSRDLTIQQKSYYNLGNARYRIGESTVQNNREATIREWESALESYQGALALDSKDKDAQFNHDLVKKRLEELKKTPPQEQEKKDQNQDQKDKQDQNKDQQNQGGQSGGDENKDDASQNKKESEDRKEKSDPNKTGDQQKKDGSGKEQDQKESPQQSPEPKKEGQENQAEAGEAKEQKDDGAKGKPLEAQPGQMTREEAKALLNAAKRGQKQLLLPITRSKDSNKESGPGRDW